MGKVLNLTYTSSLTNLCEVNSSFDAGVLRICYTGQNRNNSFISKQAIERGKETIYNCPIVCNYDRETDTLGGHDVEVVASADGDLKLVNLTQPVGVIPESAKVWFEDYEEEDGTVNQYLYADVLLWKRQEAYEKIKKDGVTAHSMEITVKDGENINGIYHINDFEFTAFALIGVEPCFESSALQTFSKNDFKQQMAEMMQDLKDSYKPIDSSSEDDNKHLFTITERGNKTLDEKMALVAKYNIDVDTLDFSLEDFTVEELEEKFKAMQAPEQNKNKFELASNLIDEIIASLEHEKIATDWGERSHYYYVDFDFEASEVYCWDTCDWLLYGFTYHMNGDRVEIDFESKKRKKYVIADFDEGEQPNQPSPFAPTFSQMEEKIKDGAAVEEKFQEASGKIATMETELTSLRQFKADAEDVAAQAQRDEIFAQFEDLNGDDAFEKLKENGKDFDLETLKEKCFAIRGMKAVPGKFSLEQKAPKLKIEKPDTNTEPYGGLFIEYGTAGSI